MIRSLVLALALFASPFALAADATTGTGGNPVIGTSGAAVPQESGMHPGVTPPPRSKHPYFFAAYGVVWLGIFLYTLWLGSRISALEERGSPKGH